MTTHAAPRDIQPGRPLRPVTHSVMQEDKSQQDVVDARTDLCRGQCFQGLFQRLHSLGDKVNAICFHSARQKSQQARVTECLQVLSKDKQKSLAVNDSKPH